MTKDYRIATIQEISRQDYLCGVIAAELGYLIKDCPFEGVKAFLIIADTFFIRRQMSARYLKRPYDITSDHNRDQAFTPERFKRLSIDDQYRVFSAIEQTAGLVITCGGSPIEAVYSAFCGGTTRSAVEIGWNPAAYLQGGSECPCPGHPNYPGKRHGHGVGVCQAGLVMLAQQEMTAGQIIKHYYGGSVAVQRTG